MVDHSSMDPTDIKSSFKDSLVNISAVCRSATSCFENALSRWKPVFRVGALLYTSLYLYMQFAKKPENIKHSTFVQINPGRCLFSHIVHLSVHAFCQTAKNRFDISVICLAGLCLFFQSAENRTSYV